MVIPLIRPENIMRSLKAIQALLITPPTFAGLETIITEGGWSAWMDSYFEKLDLEISTAEDERICDLLLDFTAMRGSRGRVVIYRYNGKNIVEVITHHENNFSGNIFFNEFDPVNVIPQIDAISEKLTKAMTEVMTECQWR